MARKRADSPSLRYRAPAIARWGMRALRLLAPPLATRLANALFCLPKRRALRAEETPLLQSARRIEIRHESRRWVGWQWGEDGAPLVLLVHGWGGRGPQLGAFGAPLARRGFRVVAYDGRAHGESPGRLAAIVPLAEDLVRISTSLGGAVAVVAHSMGGMVTARALHRGLPARRVVFVSPPGEMIFYSNQFVRALDLDEDMHARMSRRFQAEFGLSLADATAENFSQGQVAPLLLVYDLGDPDVPLAHSRRWAKAWPQVEEVRTRGLGHRRILHDPQVIERVSAFVAEPASDRREVESDRMGAARQA